MAATLIQQLYSQNHWADIDGVQTIWNFTFAGGYIFPDHVKAYYLDADGERVPVIVTEDMLIGEFQLQVTPAIPATATRFVIYRDTPKDLPLVDFADGAVVSEANLDRAAEQAIFCVAELLDGVFASDAYDLGQRLLVLEALADEWGYKALKQVAYTGASVLALADNGKSHYKTDATSVTVPNTLPVTFLSTIVNDSTSTMTVNFTDGVGIVQGSGDAAGDTSFTLAARSLLSLTKVASGRWFISGAVV